MIIDAHVHILPERICGDPSATAARDPWFAQCHAGGRRMATAESLIDAMDIHGVDRAVCLGWPFTDAEVCAESNDYIAAAQHRHPDRIIGFGIVQPRDPGAVREVQRCGDLGLHGIGEVNADAQGFSLGDQALLQPLIDASLQADLIWTVHCSEPVGHSYAGKGTSTPDVIATFAQRNDLLTTICAHLGGGLPFFAHMPEVARLCSRLWFDTAAQPFLYEPSAYRAIVDSIGSSRLLFGSDHPLLDLPRYRDAMRAAPVSDIEAAEILGGNAARLFGR